VVGLVEQPGRAALGVAVVVIKVIEGRAVSDVFSADESYVADDDGRGIELGAGREATLDGHRFAEDFAGGVDEAGGVQVWVAVGDDEGGRCGGHGTCFATCVCLGRWPLIFIAFSNSPVFGMKSLLLQNTAHVW